MFYNLCRKEGKEITCLFDNVFEDNGYRYDDFGDFATVPFLQTYLHFIGPIKRDRKACDLMSRVLLRDYPEYFFKVAALFQKSTGSYCMQHMKIKNLPDLELKYSKNQLPKEESHEEEAVFEMPYPLNMNGGIHPPPLGELEGAIDKMKEWCNEAEISFTPTLFINGHRLPEKYKIEELQYIL